MTDPVSERQLIAIKKAIDTQGFSFQSAVAKAICDIGKRQIEQMILVDVELPVHSGAGETKVDLVAFRRVEPLDLGGILEVFVFECKRANPALSKWCFASSGAMKGRRRGYHWLQYDSMVLDKKKEPTEIHHVLSQHTASESGPLRFPCAHFGFEVKSGQKGDSYGGGRDAIEQACSQVMRGVAGLRRLYREQPGLFPFAPDQVTFIPVILTTAQLYAVATDLDTADLLTGELTGNPDASHADTIILQYMRSSNFGHGDLADQFGALDLLNNYTLHEHVRSIAIVQASGLQGFIADYPKSGRNY